MKTSIIIQARTGSKRLPKKVLSKIQGRTMIWHVINRTKLSKMTQQIILATTKNYEDKKLLDMANNCDIFSYIGKSRDVLSRFYDCAKFFDADPIIRITGDCPMIDPKLIDKMIRFYLKNKFDYVSNTIIPTYPDGLDIEVFSFKTLEKSMKNAKLNSEREHVTSYIKNNPKKFHLYNYRNKIDLSNLRWTVDEEKDLKLIKMIYSKMKPKLYFTTEDILNLLKKNPNLSRINQSIKRNEGYELSLKKEQRKPS